MKLKLKYNEIKTITTQQDFIPKFKHIQLLNIKQSTYCVKKISFLDLAGF